MNNQIHLIIKGLGWSKSSDTNWCYRYYDITIITNNLDLLKLQGIYIDTFGSLTNYFSSLRDIKNIDTIVDENLLDIKLPQKKMLKMGKNNDFKNIYNLISKL